MGQVLGLVPSRSRSGIKPLGSLAFYSVRSLDGGLAPCRLIRHGFFFSKEKLGFLGSEKGGNHPFFAPFTEGCRSQGQRVLPGCKPKPDRAGPTQRTLLWHRRPGALGRWGGADSIAGLLTPFSARRRGIEQHGAERMRSQPPRMGRSPTARRRRLSITPPDSHHPQFTKDVAQRPGSRHKTEGILLTACCPFHALTHKVSALT
jgi:hypothetical protein